MLAASKLAAAPASAGARPAHGPTTASATSSEAAPDDEITPEVLAVLTAAATEAVQRRVTPELLAVLGASATAALGVRVRVRRVIRLDEDVRSWVAGGRADVMQSHRLGAMGQLKGQFRG